MQILDLNWRVRRADEAETLREYEEAIRLDKRRLAEVAEGKAAAEGKSATAS